MSKKMFVDDPEEDYYMESYYTDGSIGTSIQASPSISSETKFRHWEPKEGFLKRMDKQQKTAQSFQDEMWNLPDEEFYEKMRINKPTFVIVENLIRKDSVFLNDSKNSQIDVRFQLFVALIRLGSGEKKAAISNVAKETGIANGTVSLYTERVLTALNNVFESYIFWPGENERKEISSGIYNEYVIPNCIGILDMVYIYFTQRPAISKEEYTVGNNKYGVSALVICDDRNYIRHITTLHPGAGSPELIWKRSKFYINPERYFNSGEFLAYSSDYISDDNLKKYESIRLNPNSYGYETSLQSSVVDKHLETIRAWKSRWGSLIKMKKQIKKSEDFKKVEVWIRATAVLHNIACEHEGRWTGSIPDDA